LYPTPLERANLQNILYLKDLCDKVGLSDHSNPHEDNLLSSKLAIFQGIDMLERHFTILNVDETRDGKVSITPDMLYELKRFDTLSKEEQYEELNEFNETQKFNHDYYRNRFCEI
jgi:N-acetylneuraminate synthase/N,N'-diacetyllegionaminate synthase